MKGTLADGVQYTFWTFGGHGAGTRSCASAWATSCRSGSRTHEKSMNPHSIDLHAVTGPGGGAAVTQLGPGQEGAFEWKALNPGLYVYHCATPSVPAHIANGMYGLILVEPERVCRGGPRVLRDAGRVLHQGQDPGARAPAARPGQADRSERPEYVVFNGDGRAAGDGALKAKVGETVRLFVGNGGPNLISSFHVIGEIFDTVYTEGAVGGGAPARNVQTTLIPAGGAAIVEMKMEVPGRFLLVDHSIVRAMDKGALGADRGGGRRAARASSRPWCPGHPRHGRALTAHPAATPSPARGERAPPRKETAMTVRELMTGAVISAPPWMPMLEARALMTKERIRHLPVTGPGG